MKAAMFISPSVLALGYAAVDGQQGHLSGYASNIGFPLILWKTFRNASNEPERWQEEG